MQIIKSRYLQEDEFSGLELRIDYQLNAAETHVLYKINGNGWIFDKEVSELFGMELSSEFLDKIAEHHFKYQYFSDYRNSKATKGVWVPESSNTKKEGSGLLTLDGFVSYCLDFEKDIKKMIGVEF